MNLKLRIWLIFIIVFIAFFFAIGYFISYTFGPYILQYVLDLNLSNIIGIVLTIFLSIIISAIISKWYYKNQLKRLSLVDSQFNDKIGQLVQDKKEISIEEIFNLYGSRNNMDFEFRKNIYKKIYSWVAKYNFQIQGDKIILDPVNISTLIDDLEKIYHKSKDRWKKV